MGLYVSPIVYPVSMIPGQYQLIYMLNPMVGVIEGFRWILLGTPFSISILITIGFIIVFIPIGLIYFKNMENEYADVV
jgi:lipopolysaccharide transport system permease protein